MNIQGFSIKRPVATLTILCLFVVIGAVAMSQTPLDLLPDIQPPVLAVMTAFPGASPQEVLSMVTKPMEDQLSLTGGLTNINSISQEGIAIIILRFNWGSDIKRAREEAEAYLDLLPLPDGARQPIIIEFDPTLLPIMELSVTGGGDDIELTQILNNQVAPRLESVRGVANVQLMGEANEDVFVRLSPSRLEEYRISFDQVAGILATSLMDLPAGIIELDGYQMRLRFLAHSHAEQQLAQMVVGFDVDVAALEQQLNRSINVDLNRALADAMPAPGSIEIPTRTIYLRDIVAEWDIRLEDGEWVLLTLDPPAMASYGLNQYMVAATLDEAGYPVEWELIEEEIRLRLEEVDWEQVLDTPVATVPDVEAWYSGLMARTRRQLDMTSRQVEQALVEMAMAMVLTSRSGSPIPGLDEDFPLQPISLADLAVVERSVHPATTISRINGEPSIGLMIQKEGTANTVAVAREVRRVLAELETELGVSFYTVFDQAEEIEGALSDLIRDLITGGILAVMVLLLFLRDFRTTLFIGAAIPASVLFTFTLLYFADLTVNIMTMGGLALAAGLLVDNAIVVSENIYRHLQEGMDPREAALTGSREVAGAIIASTLTTVSVFFPVVFLSGLAGELFREFALTVSCALLASLAISFTLIPLMASRFLQLRKERGKKPALFRYRQVVDWCLDRRWVPLAVALAVVVGAGVLFTYMGTDLFPVTEEDSFVIDINLPPGTPLAQTDAFVSQLETVLAGRDEIQSSSVRVGAAQFFGMSAQGGASNRGRVRVVVEPAYSQDIPRLIDELRAEMAGLNPEAELYFNRESILDTAGMEAQLELVVEGEDQAGIQSLAEQISSRLSQLDFLSDIQFTLEENRPEVHVHMDHQQALQQGVSVYQVATTLRQAMEGMPVARVLVGEEVLQLILGYDKAELATVDDVRNLGIYSAQGNYLRLGEVADFTQAFGPASISRENRKTTGEIHAQYYGLDMAAATNRALAVLEELEVPPGYDIRPAGTFSLMDDVFSELELVLLVSAVLVYLVMAAQFESFVNPFIIITSLPMAFAGSVYALRLTGNTLSVPAMIGAVVLAGILVNDGIILVDLMNQKYRFQNVPLRQAVLDGAAARVRPVLMITITTILGLFPLALGLGSGSQLQAPMAIAIIGGQVVGTVLLLVVIPVLFWSINRLSRQERAASAEK